MVFWLVSPVRLNIHIVWVSLNYAASFRGEFPFALILKNQQVPFFSKSHIPRNGDYRELQLTMPRRESLGLDSMCVSLFDARHLFWFQKDTKKKSQLWDSSILRQPQMKTSAKEVCQLKQPGTIWRSSSIQRNPATYPCAPLLLATSLKRSSSQWLGPEPPTCTS